MTRAAIATATAAPGVSRGLLLQRKCACAEHGESSRCEECGKDKLQRKAAGSFDPKRVPAIVERVLRAPGQPLQDQARTFMEQRFAHNFGAVRVHIDAEAARSARAVGAAAYTVGRNVVFNHGRYAPDTANGRRLLAHELTHVVQQHGTHVSAFNSLTIANSNGALERAAEASADAIGDTHSSRPVDSRMVSAGQLQRAGMGELREAEAIFAERAARKDAAKDGKPAAMDNKILTVEEHTAIDVLIAKGKLPTASPLAHPMGSTFLLHDTSGLVGAAKLKQHQDEGRGPLGVGVSAWVPRDTDAVVARPAFFEDRRPSTTEYERARDIFKLPGDASIPKTKDKIAAWTGRRDDLFRTAWNATLSSAQTLALDDALAGKGLTPAEIAEEKTGDTKKGKEHKTGAVAQLSAGSGEEVRTTAAWAVGEICKQVGTKGAAAVANPKQDTILADACKALGSYFIHRELRALTIVPVEIVQVGVIPDEKPDPKKTGATKPGEKPSDEKKAATKPGEKKPDKKQAGEKKAAGAKPAGEKPREKNPDTCDITNPDIMPMPKPPYSQNQYTNIAGLYLRAAHIAGRFPSVSTHFVADAFVQGHCDPRCFDIKKLYGEIAGGISHPAGCTYGIIPNFGTKSGTNNIWWNDKICGGSPPP
jgi:hypothetical protein